MDKLDKPVCLLTGASGTLGLHFCRYYATRYHIAAVYNTNVPRVPSQRQRYIDPLEPTADLGANQHPVFSIQADVSTAEGLQHVIDFTLARFDRIDLVVNAAGTRVAGSMGASCACLASLTQTFEINALTPVRLSTLVAQRFWRHRPSENRRLNRCVINMSALMTIERGARSGGDIAFSSSKAALNTLTEYLADEFAAFGIRVNTIAPDRFPSAIPVDRVAKAALVLASGSMTGRILALYPDREVYLP